MTHKSNQCELGPNHALGRLVVGLNLALVTVVLLALPTQSPAAVGVDWQSHTTSTAHGNLNGITVDVTNLAEWPFPVDWYYFDVTGPDYGSFPLGQAQKCVDYAFDENWNATFSPPATDLLLYCIYWRGPNISNDPPIFEYTFDQPFTIVSGLTNCSISGNTLNIPSTTFQHGILRFTGPVSSVGLTANNANNSSRQILTFGLDVPLSPGACCWQDANGVWGCQEVWEGDCTGVGGRWHGNGVTCSNVACPPSPDIGACCWHEDTGGWACVEMLASDCAVLDGTWHGGTTQCSDIDCPDPQELVACCYEDANYGLVCIDVTADDCELLDSSGNYGPGTFCSDPFVECPPLYTEGACCYEDNSIMTCGIMTEAACDALPSSTWYGIGVQCNDPVVQCDPIADVGACCFPHGGIMLCGDVGTEADCDLITGSVWHGVGVPCTQVDCNQPPTLGACCFLDPVDGLLCLDVTETDCDDLGGMWHAGLACSDPAIDCTVYDFSGACCTVNGCIVLSLADCHIAGGQWYGIGATCDQTACPDSGACCVCNGCLPMIESDCQTAGGNWLVGAACSDCPPTNPSGACCMNLGCATMTQSDCDGVNGTWLGSGSGCAACPPPCPWDIDNDGVVRIDELLGLLNAFGPCP
jgi:hypothetical protein